MNRIEIFKMAFTNLFRRKARSILAILGVLIGTASIVIMVSIGLGMSKNFNDQMKKNANLHIIQIFGTSMKKNQASPTKMKMDDKAVDAIKKIHGVTKVTGKKQLQTRIIIGNYVSSVSLNSIDPDFLEKLNIKLSKGRMLQKSDKFKFLIGKQIPPQFENYKSGVYLNYSPDGKYDINLLNNKIEVTNDPKYKQSRNEKRNNSSNSLEKEKEAPKYDIFKAEGIGVIDNDSEYGYSILTTLDTINAIEKSNSKAEQSAGQKKSRLDNQNTYSAILVYIEDINQVSKVIDELKLQGFEFYSVMDFVKEEQKKFAMIQGALGGIGAISLLVAALGITNTMIMSIYERTREIGVMKVIGASLKDIKNMFLYEAAAIGLIGGVIGSILSIIVSFVLNMLYANFSMNGNMPMSTTAEVAKPYISYIPIWLILFGVIFSGLIGVVSGYIPAKKAMSLSALESLRND